MTASFYTGIDVLVTDRRDMLAGRRIGLALHPASLLVDGQWSAERLWQDPGMDLACLLGPEHGVFGGAGAGERVPSQPHPQWGIPIHSLYGEHRRPTADIMASIDVLVIDFQDLGVRCFTYVSTLFLLLNAAAEFGVPVVVTDRPIPLPDILDGPLLDPAFESFVAQVPLPMVYGMTQGETALYLHALNDWDLELHVIPMRDYKSDPSRRPGGPPWVPPSPGIRSWESAWCYPATVFTEALPSLDCGRGGPLPFQVLGAPWFSGHEAAGALADAGLPGVRIYPHSYFMEKEKGKRQRVDGIRLAVTDPAVFQPVTTGLTILEALQELAGTEPMWDTPDARPGFFDQLCGTDSVRLALLDRVPVRELAEAWRIDRTDFVERRTSCRLYP